MAHYDDSQHHDPRISDDMVRRILDGEGVSVPSLPQPRLGRHRYSPLRLVYGAGATPAQLFGSMMSEDAPKPRLRLVG